jgi:hypothetical protein
VFVVARPDLPRCAALAERLRQRGEAYVERQTVGRHQVEHTREVDPHVYRLGRVAE